MAKETSHLAAIANSQYVFTCCQIGAEKALKRDVARRHGNLTFAFSRPGFVTFKRKDASRIDRIESPFARTFGFHFGQIKSAPSDSAELAREVARLLQSNVGTFQHLHVWQRDQAVPGERGFEPFVTDEMLDFGKAIREALGPDSQKMPINRRGNRGDVVADVIKLDADHVYLGGHPVASNVSSWPGGIPLISPPAQMISRAHLKMQEALRWSNLPVKPGDICCELGSAPGGSCQALLERDLHVIGVDPAIMDKRVLAIPNFTHHRARAADLKRKEFADVRWLMTDANIAPESTLDAVEPIVTHRQVHITGMLLTLKLLDWSLAAEIDDYLERIRGWGYRYIRTRQLAFNRREICVLAARNKTKLRLNRSKGASGRGQQPGPARAMPSPEPLDRQS